MPCGGGGVPCAALPLGAAQYMVACGGQRAGPAHYGDVHNIVLLGGDDCCCCPHPPPPACAPPQEYDIHTLLDGLTLCATGWVIFSLRGPLRESYQREMDALNPLMVAGPCLLLACVAHPSTRHFILFRVGVRGGCAWVCCCCASVVPPAHCGGKH